MTKKDRPVYAFRRKGNALVPDMDFDTRALDGISQGQKVRVTIGQWRNLDRLRAYWATLQECVDATGCAPHKEALDSYVRLAAGHADQVWKGTEGGVKRGTWVPRRLDRENCTEEEMIAFFQAAEEVLARDFGFVSENGEEGAEFYRQSVQDAPKRI